FGALKFDPFPGPWRTHISREAEQQVVETVRVVRDAVGPKVDLLIEVHRRLAPMHAVRVARSLEPFEPFWVDEPVSARDMGARADCARGGPCEWVVLGGLRSRSGSRSRYRRGTWGRWPTAGVISGCRSSPA